MRIRRLFYILVPLTALSVLGYFFQQHLVNPLGNRPPVSNPLRPTQKERS